MPNLPRVLLLILSLVLGIACLRHTDWILSSVVQINIDKVGNYRQVDLVRSIIHAAGYVLVSIFILGVLIIIAILISP